MEGRGEDRRAYSDARDQRGRVLEKPRTAKSDPDVGGRRREEGASVCLKGRVGEKREDGDADKGRSEARLQPATCRGLGPREARTPATCRRGAWSSLGARSGRGAFVSAACAHSQSRATSERARRPARAAGVGAPRAPLSGSAREPTLVRLRGRIKVMHVRARLRMSCNYIHSSGLRDSPLPSLTPPRETASFLQM